jgi:iron complex outermembrane receptor protein
MASGAMLAATLGATSVQAQSKPTNAAAAASTNTIEELVVTAEKRAQSLQDVPVAISAFTSEKRDLIGINTIADMTNFTPGLEYNASNDRNTLRGIGRLTNVHAADISVAQYSDGIYTSSTVEAGKTPLFLDRVEVLRGPQGTLYGRNSIGGAINIISKHPTEDPYAEVRAQYQNFDHYIIEAAASGPTPVPGLQFRIGANWEKQTQGWFHNVLPGQHDEGGVIDQTYLEGQLQWKFNDRFDVWAKLATANWENAGGGPGQRTGYTIARDTTAAHNILPSFASYQLASPAFYNQAGYACFPNTGVSNITTVGGISLASACTNPASFNVRDYASPFQASAKLTGVVIFSSDATFHFDHMDLKYLAGGTRYNYQAILPGDAPGITGYTLPNLLGGPKANVLPREASYYREDLTWFSHELNLASTGEGPFQWIVGAYYYDERYLQPTAGVLLDQPLNALPFFLPGTFCQFTGNVCPSDSGVRPNSFYDDRPVISTTSAAAYGQIDWKFATDWKLTLGLRYTRDRKHGTEDGRLLCLSAASCSGGFGPELLGNFLIDLTQLPGTVTAGVFPGSAGAPGTPTGKGVSSLTTFDPATGMAHRTLDDHWSATTGTAGVQWQPNSDTMAYFRYSRGYKAGGFNVGAASFFNPNTETDPEHVNAYEVGLKKEFGRTIQANLAIFYYDYSNYQAPVSIVPTGGGVGVAQGVFFNIPKSVSQGVELETTWQPIDHLQVLFNYSYLDAHITSATGVVDSSDPTAVAPGAKPTGALTPCGTPALPGCDVFTGFVTRGQDLSGNRLPNAPKNKVALNVNYTWDLATGSLTGGASYIWRDKQYGTIFTRWYNEAPAWDQIDLRMVYKDKNNKYSIIAFVKNVGDNLGYEAGSTSARRVGTVPAYTLGLPGAAPAGPATATPVFQGINTTYTLTPPRTYGVELQYRFF